jgi:hypothetical protein
MNTGDVNAIIFDFFLVFSSFFVVFGGVYLVLRFFEGFLEDAFTKPPEGGKHG